MLRLLPNPRQKYKQLFLTLITMQKYINFLWFKYVKHIFSTIPIYKKTLFWWKKFFIHHITVGHGILSWHMMAQHGKFFLTFFSTFSQCPNATDFRNRVVRFLRLRNHIGKDHIGIRFKYGPSYTPPKSPLREHYLNYIVILIIEQSSTNNTSICHS